MKKYIQIVAFLCVNFITLNAVDFNTFFKSESCRVDFHFAGNKKNCDVFVEKILKEPFWGGRKHHLDQSLNLGEYKFEVYDSLTSQLIYQDGFSSLFYEWQSTPEAKTMHKSFEQTIQFPLPKQTAQVKVMERIDLFEWKELSSFYINPEDKLIKDFKIPDVKVRKWVSNENTANAVDIAVIAEGYSEKEVEKFFKDAEKLKEHLLTHEPFKSYGKNINVYGVAAWAPQSGISKPQDNVWVKSALSSHYHTFYAPRYLTTNAVFTTRDYASAVPYDVIYILANSKTYGGGGIYNHYALTSSEGPKAVYVTVHEFGHSFAGLGDEYFYDHSDVLDGMYDLKKEPWEPNITTLVNFDYKWKSLLKPGVEIPSSVSDSVKVKTGVFEGGGYLSKGIYRPAYTCRMKDNKSDSFCEVCQKGIERVILFLTDLKD